VSDKAPTKFSIRGPGGLRLTVDRDEVFPDDPGNGTPCMLNLFEYSGTLAMACSEGELNSTRGDKKLSQAQCRWVNEVEDDANAYAWENDDQAFFRLKLLERP